MLITGPCISFGHPRRKARFKPVLYIFLSGGSVYAARGGPRRPILGGHVVCRLRRLDHTRDCQLRMRECCGWRANWEGVRGWRMRPANSVYKPAHTTSQISTGAERGLSFIAVSSIPILIASALSLARSRRVATHAGGPLSSLLAARPSPGRTTSRSCWETLVITLLPHCAPCGASARAWRRWTSAELPGIVTLGALAVAANAWFPPS